MNIINYIQNHYGVSPEYLWQDTPNVCVFRHQHNRKWFAVVMNDIPAAKLGLKENNSLNLINLKCEPELAKKILRFILRKWNIIKLIAKRGAKSREVITFLVTVYCFKLFYTIKTCFLL